MNEKSDYIYNTLHQAVVTDQLRLPTLPDVALNIRNAVDKEHSSAQQIAEILTQDAALAARLLQLANSPLYRARSEIDNLQMAVTRLGTRIVRDLVITLAMRQIYQARSDALNQQFKALWTTSVEVAAICRTLATTQPTLNPEQALLAGLIHNIGALPILQLAEDQSELFNDQQSMVCVIKDIQGKVGEMMLKFWNFPAHLVDVVSQWNNFSRLSDKDADYVDLVQTAILHSGHTAMADIPDRQNPLNAFHKLGLDNDDNFWLNEDNKTNIEETRQSLIAI